MLSLIGILLPQIPDSVAGVAGGPGWWLENVVADSYGVYANLLSALGLFNIFHSIWFLGAVSILMLNILVCSISRIRSLLLNSTKAVINQDAGFYQGGRLHAEFSSTQPSQMIEEQAVRIMRRHHFSQIICKGRKSHLFGW